MQDPTILFKAAMGQIIWGACVSYGSSVFFEFGSPRLRIREPLEKETTVPALKRRKVRTVGAFELLVVDCYWKITTNEESIDSYQNLSSFNTIFSLMSGEILNKIIWDKINKKLILLFDLGSKLIIARDNFNKEKYTMFMIVDENDKSIAYSSDGSVQI